MDQDVKRRVPQLQEVDVADAEERQDDPIGRHDADQPPGQEGAGALIASAEGQAGAAQDDKHIDAKIAVQNVAPAYGAAEVVGDNEDDRHALELIEHLKPSGDGMGKLQL